MQTDFFGCRLPKKSTRFIPQGHKAKTESRYPKILNVAKAKQDYGLTRLNNETMT